jgi:hypothetical protein
MLSSSSRLAEQEILRKLKPATGPSGGAERQPSRFQILVRAQRAPDAVSLGRKEREAHAAADAHRVGELEKAPDGADLASEPGATDDRHQRPFGARARSR